MSTDNHSAFSADSSTPVHPNAQSFLLPGGSVGILFVHGFGGSIGDFRPLAEDFHRQGFTCLGVRLAGHGQTPAALAETTLEDWRESVFLAARELKQTCDAIILVASSFGGGLIIDYAVHAPEKILGVVTINTGLKYSGGGKVQKLLLRQMQFFRSTYPKKFKTEAERQKTIELGSLLEWPINGILENYVFLERFVRPALPRLRTPLLVLVNPNDPIIDVVSARELFDLAGANVKEFQELTGQAHNPLRSPELRAEVLSRVQKFVRTLESQA